MEPWDGPAAISFTDGDWVGAVLDRNGLRPVRYEITDDGLMILGSEIGIVTTDDAHVIEKGRLAPGEMMAIDLTKGKLYHNPEIKKDIKNRKPYGQWLKENIVKLESIQAEQPNGQEKKTDLTLLQREQIFAFSPEDLKEIIRPMIMTSKEPVFSMGDDTPLAVLSSKPRLVYSYFKQRFAQVTNPPIDPEREELVMSVNMYLGARKSFLEETPGHAHLIELDTPILTDEGFTKLESLGDGSFRSDFVWLLLVTGLRLPLE